MSVLLGLLGEVLLFLAYHFTIKTRDIYFSIKNNEKWNHESKKSATFAVLSVVGLSLLFLIESSSISLGILTGIGIVGSFICIFNKKSKIGLILMIISAILFAITII